MTGSYGRRIAVLKIKDVDFVVFVDETYATLGPLQALLDLEAALNALADELAEDGERPVVELRPQRRSVRVHFTAEDFYLDVVPVRSPEGPNATRLLVPDREWKTWQPTACVAYGRHFSALNQGTCEELLVPLMKTIKHWRTLVLKRDQAKSFWVEALIINLIERGQITFAETSLAEVIAETCHAIAAECRPYLAISNATPVVPDPMLPGENPNVAFNWDRGDFETFMRRIDDACALVDKAVAADTAADAIAAWQKLLGEEYFPAKVDDEEAAAKEADLARNVTVAAGGTVFTRTPPVSQPVTHPRGHQFHGDH